MDGNCNGIVWATTTTTATTYPDLEAFPPWDLGRKRHAYTPPPPPPPPHNTFNHHRTAAIKAMKATEQKGVKKRERIFARRDSKDTDTRYAEKMYGRHREYLDAMTSSQPTNSSEWQLYRVLQRANLLQYYDTFIAQGGDDVQQLCEAGEEEFLEIMALVGMASKPLHVRRLQKALQEWVANPAAFQGPVVGSSSPAPGSISATVRDQTAVNTYPTLHSTPPIVNAPTWNPATHAPPRNISPANTGSSSGASPQADIKVESTGRKCPYTPYTRTLDPDLCRDACSLRFVHFQMPPKAISSKLDPHTLQDCFCQSMYPAALVSRS